MLYLHPVALLALLLIVLGSGEWPRGWMTAGWIVAPVLLNWMIWGAGCELFGFSFAGLGAAVYAYTVLPFNGLLLGLAAPQFLHSRLKILRSDGYEFAAGVMIEVAILFANLAILSRVPLVVSFVTD